MIAFLPDNAVARMRGTRGAVCAAAVLAAVVSPSFAGYLQPDPHSFTGRESFELSVSQRFDKNGSTVLNVHTAVPSRRIVFVRKERTFEGAYRTYIVIKDEKGKYVWGDVVEKTVIAQSYEETRSPTSVSVSDWRVCVKPGVYTVQVIVEVLQTSLKYSREEKVRITGRTRDDLSLADPVLFTPSSEMQDRKPQESVIEVSPCPQSGDEDFIINASGDYRGFFVWPRIGYILMMPVSVVHDSVLVTTRVRDASGRVFLYRREQIKTGASEQVRICTEFNVDYFPIGVYVVSMVVEIPGSTARASNERSFNVLLNRGFFTKHFDSTMHILSVIADEDELADLAAAAPQERINAWLRFWKRRDSAPHTQEYENLEEFFHRLKYVLQHFSRMRAGWETDRGRIYLKYGEPDKITDGSGGLMGSQYQLWYYYSRNIVYIFEDVIGTGEFQLVDTRMI